MVQWTIRVGTRICARLVAGKIGRRRALLVRRFDVTPQNGRLHMVSLRTLCLERPGVYVHAYSDLAQVIRKYSALPNRMLQHFFAIWPSTQPSAMSTTISRLGVSMMRPKSFHRLSRQLGASPPQPGNSPC